MIERLTAGIDWISGTLGNDEEDYHEWRRQCYTALERVVGEGYVYGPRKLLGYEGHSAGNCFVGENNTGSYAQFTGERADWAFDYIYHERAHYSRIDLQITVKRDVMSQSEGKRCYRAAERNNEGLPIGRRRKLWFISGSDGGYTFYLGSPSSEQRGRIYNKEVQSEDIDFVRCWRYEVVYRNELSTRLAATIATSDVERAKQCLSQVLTWLNQRGVSIPDVGNRHAEPLRAVRTRPTDVETKLRWLKEQVSPSVRYLLDLGMREVTLDVLGLTDALQS